jgi:hypothetical protein
MRVDGINPSLVFFDKDLEEHQIMKCVSILQGDKIPDDKKVQHFSILKDIS